MKFVELKFLIIGLCNSSAKSLLGMLQSPFMGNIWGADLADMQLICKLNQRFRFLLNVIDIYRKYSWVIPSKDKNSIKITDAFQNFLKESNRKSNKICVDKVSLFYNRSMKSWLE